MFDDYTRKLIDSLPILEAFDGASCRRLLSTAYAQIVSKRLRLSSDDNTTEEAKETVAGLRKLADALESIAVFDPLTGIDVPLQTVTASAFVAAESLALVRQLESRNEEEREPDGDTIVDAATYAALESALLYMIGGYDINAVAVLRSVPETFAPVPPSSASDVFYYSRLLRDRVAALCRGRVSARRWRPVLVREDLKSPILEDIILGLRCSCYRRIAEAIDHYFQWLSGDGDEGLSKATAGLRGLLHIIGGQETDRVPAVADVYHLTALVLAAILRTSARALVRVVPPPEGVDGEFLKCFLRYLRDRATGTRTNPGRPYMWPSALEYCTACLPGPHANAVVSLPTGSGKSFVAELAIAHALSRGWVLYLAPTNALVEQIRRDLRYSLRAFKDLDTLAFVGGAEYMDVAEDRISNETKRVVAVMTPEKCALLLRTSPEAFEACALCVFDECHLLRDKHRGITADIVMAQVFRSAPSAKYLLMSAMMSNAGELANWLDHVLGGKAEIPKVNWRPSRTARGFVVIDRPSLKEKWTLARDKLSSPSSKRVKMPFSVPLQAIIGLSGPWTKDGPDDYRLIPLPVEAELGAKRDDHGKIALSSDGWKNDVGKAVAVRFALRGVPAINFILSSKHHPFSHAIKVAKQEPFANVLIDLPPLVEALLGVAQLELGAQSIVRSLLRSGIAVHTSAMLSAEQEASEFMFSSAETKLMFATGTLAQGLNLPAIAVVISGTSIGDPRELADPKRVEEMILNGFGRAGRPGFANQGIVFLVSDKPMSADASVEKAAKVILGNYSVLGKADAAVGITSPIEALLDQFSSGEAPEAKALELELTSVLAGQGEEAEKHPWDILRRTLAAFRRRDEFMGDKAEAVNEYVASLKKNFIDDAGVPSWMPRAAMIAGVNIRRAIMMWDALKRAGIPEAETFLAWSVTDWLHFLIDIISRLPPEAVAGYREVSKRPVPAARLEQLSMRSVGNLSGNWSAFEEWRAAWRTFELATLAYMSGQPYANVARILFDNPALPVSDGRGSNAVIPYTLSFVDSTLSYSLAIDAGCLLALLQEHFCTYQPRRDVPEALRALSFCIRNGCDRIDVLAWYRFGIPYRVCAHALARKFPMPAGTAEGQERIRWVKDTLRKWLDRPENASFEEDALRYAYEVLKIRE